MKITYINRKTGKEEVEVVAGEKWIQWSYETQFGRKILELFIKRRLLSHLMGAYMDLPLSKRRIQEFISHLNIDMKEAEQEDPGSYQSFNEFFTRPLKPEARPLDQNQDRLISPADGRLLVYEGIEIDRVVQIKGLEYGLAELVGDRKLADQYEKGTCLIVRLTPADYHRFHFPDQGVPSSAKNIPGAYYSVNPTALQAIAKLYCQNKRSLTRFKSEHFGQILMLEIGATGVGSIVQTYQSDQPVKKGQEKGYFKFGGSTVLLFFQRDQVKMDQDLVENSLRGVETLVKMGESIGSGG